MWSDTTTSLLSDHYNGLQILSDQSLMRVTLSDNVPSSHLPPSGRFSYFVKKEFRIIDTLVSPD